MDIRDWGGGGHRGRTAIVDGGRQEGSVSGF